MVEVAKRFPLLRIRPELAGNKTQLFIPITVQATAVGAALVTLHRTVSWDPDTWNFMTGVQSLLSLYMRVTERVWLPIRPTNPDFAIHQGLTDRQRAILQLVARGKSTTAIAARIGFSSATIKADLRRAMLTLEVADRQLAVQRAQDLGLIPTAPSA
jgi:DNA-binding NarL/FixJ family response regulator